MILKFRADLLFFLMLLRGFHFITACTIGLVRIERFRPGIGLLKVVTVPVYRFHTLNTVLRHTVRREFVCLFVCLLCRCLILVAIRAQSSHVLVWTPYYLK